MFIFFNNQASNSFFGFVHLDACDPKHPRHHPMLAPAKPKRVSSSPEPIRRSSASWPALKHKKTQVVAARNDNGSYTC